MMTDYWPGASYRWTLAWAAGLTFGSACGQTSDGQRSLPPGASSGVGGQSPTNTESGAGAAARGTDAGAGGGLLPTAGGSAAAGGPTANGGGPNAEGGSVQNTQPPLPSSNSRLEAWQLEAEGAPPLVLGSRFWDTQQQVFCSFVHAENGELRCFPDVPANHSYSDTYADPECKKDIAWIYQADGQKPAARPWAQPLLPQAPALPCEPTRYQALRPISEDNPWFRIGANGCQQVSDPPVPLQLKMVVDAPENWQLGTERDGPRLTNRLHAVQVTMADGGGFVTRFVDERWKVSCTLSRGAMGVECRSPTTSARYGALFADDACQVDLVAGEKCQEPGFGIYNGAAYALGAPFAGVFFEHRAGAQACQVAGATDNASAAGILFFRKGAPLTAAETAPMPVREGTLGSGRLRLRGLVDETGALLAIGAPTFPSGSYPYFDSVANEDCQPLWTPDGHVRCVPASVALLSPGKFSDSDCKQVAFSCDKGAACDTQKVVFGQRDTYGRTVVSVAFATSTRLDKTDVYVLNSVRCTLSGTAVAGMSLPTSALSWELFPTLKERHADAAP